MNAIQELEDYLRKNCSWNITVKKLMSCIEQEYIELPKDKNGKTISVGTTLKGESSNMEYKVTGVFFERDETRLALEDCGGVQTPSGFYVSEPDSQEKIDADSLMPSHDYCLKYSLDFDFSNYTKVCLLDLLRRQRELLEGK